MIYDKYIQRIQCDDILDPWQDNATQTKSHKIYRISVCCGYTFLVKPVFALDLALSIFAYGPPEIHTVPTSWTYAYLMKQFRYGIVSYLTGALILCIFSAIQKEVIGAPFTLNGFYVPFFLGGIAGLIIGLWNNKLKDEIEKRGRIEKKLRESEEQYRDLFENAGNLIQIVRADGSFLYVNPAWCEALGYEKNELDNLYLWNIIHPDHRNGCMDRFQRVMDGEQVGDFETVFVSKTGKTIMVEGNSSCLMKNGKPVTTRGIFHNVTDRRHAEADRDRLLTAIEQAAETIVITDTDGNIQYVNPAFERTTGYAKEEVIGNNPRVLQSGAHVKSFYRQMWQTLAAGDTWRGKLINRKKDKSFYTEDASISPVFDEAGKIVNFVAVKRDISDEMLLEEKLRQAQKMEAIGTLAGGIAHDFNNILSGIFGYVQLVQLNSGENPKVQSYIGELWSASKRAKDLVQQILTFSRQGKSEKQPTDIGVIVKEALKLIRASLPATIEVRQKIIADFGTVEADPTQIHQIVMNLCTNAFHAMQKEGGYLDVELMPVRISDCNLSDYQSLKPGNYLKLTVSDTGCGMDADTISRIFEPYFTTREPGEGTGMGLATVHGVVKGHGGDIKVYSEPGVGTTFHILFPVVESSPEEATEKLDILPKGSEKILFVDDEEPIVEIGKELLENLGYHVETKTSPYEALEAIRAQPGKYDIIITDLTMPKMTGDKLAEEIKRIHPEIPIILCTGFSNRITPENAMEIGISSVLMKPLTLSDMAKTVRKVMDETRQSILK